MNVPCRTLGLAHHNTRCVQQLPLFTTTLFVYNNSNDIDSGAISVCILDPGLASLTSSMITKTNKEEKIAKSAIKLL